MGDKMNERFSRTELIFGEEAMQRLSASRVAVFGIGGVGGYVTEALARSGIGALDLIDSDRVSVSNINRQIIAADSTLGMYKTEAARERIHDINPGCRVNIYNMFYLPETKDSIDISAFDYIIDAVDTVTAKLEIITNAFSAGVPVISSMGAGNKTDPSAFEVADIYETSVCPLARVMRHECRKRNIDRLTVVYSKEKPLVPLRREYTETGKAVPGSCVFAVAAAGLLIAGAAVKRIAFGEENK